MTARSWIRNVFARPATRTIRTVPHRGRLALEALEDRALLSLTPTAISVSASSAALFDAQTETFTATVITPGGAPTSGTVTFYDGATALSSVTVSGSPATAALTTATLALGSHTITAAYSGNGTFAASRSGVEATSLQSVVPAAGLNHPSGVAVDGSGDVFIADGERVVVVRANGTQTTIADGFNFSPGGVVADAQGDVFFTDSFHGRVTEVRANGTFNPIADGFNFPEGVAVDGAGNVFVADFGANQVVRVWPDGGRSTVGSGLSAPTGVAVDTQGDVFIADTFNNRVVEVKANGTQTAVGSGLSAPTGVAVDGSGDVFVAGGGRVVEVRANGAQTAVGSGLSDPQGVAVDAQGDLFIADSGNNRVVKVTAGVPVTVFSRTPAIAVTVSAAAPVFGQSETLTATVTTPSGAPAPVSGTVTFYDGATELGTATLSGSPATATLANSSLAGGSHTITAAYSGDSNFTATGSAGVSVTVSPAPTTISVRASAAAPVFGQSETFTATLTTSSGAATPVSGAVTFYDGATALGTATLSGSPATATLITAALAVGPHTISAAYSGDGNFAGSRLGVEATSPQSVVPATGLNYPDGVAVDAQGNLFIADTFNSRVVKVKPDGTQTLVGSGLSYPTAVAVDGSGNLFIADYDNNSVVKVKPDGTQIPVGSGLNKPTSVAVDAQGDVFIAGGGRLVEVKADGTQTPLESGLLGPYAVAVDGSGNLFVADYGHNRVVEVKPDGTQIPVGSGIFLTPSGLAVDGSGNLFIAELHNNSVVEVKADGTQTTIGSGLGGPYAVAVDGSGNVFIADSDNNQVVKVTAGLPVTVSPATPTSTTVSPSVAASTYGDSVTFTATVTSTSGPTGGVNFVIDGTSVAGVPGGTTGTTATWTFTTSALTAGIHTVKADFAGTGGFVNSSATLSDGHVVNKAASAVVVTVNGGPFTYTGSAQTPATVTVTGAGGLNLTPTASYTNNVNAGTAVASYAYAGDANHESSGGSTTFSIGKATATVAVSGYSGGTYDGSSHSRTVTVTGVASDGQLYSTGLTGTNAGSYSLPWSSTNPNYSDAGGALAFTIAKAASAVVVTVNGGPFTYTGSAQTPATVTVTGVGLNLAPTASYANNVNAGTATASCTFAGDANHTGSADSETFTIGKATAAVVVGGYTGGTYDGGAHTQTVTVTGVSGDGQLYTTSLTGTNAGSHSLPWSSTNPNYSDAGGALAFTIAKADATVVVTPYAVTYDGSPHTATVTSITGVNGEAGAAVGTVTLSGPHTNAGTYSDAWSFAGTANYNGIVGTAITDTIDQAALTITANDDIKVYGTVKTFDGTAFTQTGLVTGDAITGVTETSPGAAAAAAVGTYAIEPGAATGTGLDNYDITYVNGTLTVFPALTVPAAQTAYEDVDKTISGISIASGLTGNLTLSLAVGHGTLTLGATTGLTVAGNGSGAVTLVGTTADLNAALAALVYRGGLNFSGGDTLSLTVGDGSFRSDSSVGITVVSAAQQSAALQAQVKALKVAGVLTAKQANILLAELSLQGNDGDVGKVGSFLNDVNGFLNSRVLTQAQADALTAAGNLLLLSVSRR